MKYSEWFRQIAKGKGIRDRRAGLCPNFKNQFDTPLWFIKDVYNITFTNWSEYSGNEVYPIKGTKHSPDRTYHKSKFKYSRFTKYGRSRRKLALWLAEQFESINL